MAINSKAIVIKVFVAPPATAVSIKYPNSWGLRICKAMLLRRAIASLITRPCCGFK